MARTHSWRLQLDLSDNLGVEVRRHLAGPGRSRVDLHWSADRAPIPAVVTTAGRPPELPAPPEGRLPTRRGAAPCGPWELAPRADWHVLVDDTGSTWSGPQPDGRLVALVCPVDLPLPRQPVGFHAAGEPEHAVRVATQVFGAPIGLLGLRAAQVPALTASERWRVGLVELLRRLLLLLTRPADDQPVSVFVTVEEHAGVRAGDPTETLTESVLLALHRDRAGAGPVVELQIAVVAKEEHWPIALADAVAWAWTAGLRAPESAAGRAIDAALRRGLLPGDSPDATDLIVAACAPARPDVGVWRALQQAASDAPPGGLAEHLLSRWEAWVSAQPQALREVVEANQTMLYGRRYTAADLRREAASLRRMGAGRDDDPATALGLAAATLADENRRGRLPTAGSTAERRALAERFDQQLPCEAAELRLRLAVAHQNALDWDAAEAALPGPDVPLPLAWRGRVFSARGQVLANRGHHSEADASLRRAQDTLSAVHGPDRALDLDQTHAYALHNRWSASPPLSAVEARSAVQGRQPLDAAALQALFTTASPLRAWRLLDVLRWMARYPEDTEHERELLLDVTEAWANEQGHPWPLIGLYRVLSLRHADVYPEDLDRALMVAGAEATREGGGPALGLIAYAIEAHRCALCRSGRTARLDDLGARLREALPLAAPRVEFGERWVEEGRALEGVMLLEGVLPFSFR